MIWQPDPAWSPLRGGRGSSSGGVWLAPAGDTGWVVKRVNAPGPDDPAELTRPDHPGYWRRELEFACDPPELAGLVPPEVGRVEEDDDGYVLWTRRTVPTAVPGPFVARALGRLAGSPATGRGWWSRRLLSQRVARTAERGGWTALTRTPVADLADAVWSRRDGLLARYQTLSRVPAHGDLVPANLLATEGEDVITIDWSAFGWAPAGADLGYLALSLREDLAVLLDCYRTGMAEAGTRHRPADGGGPGDVAFAARAMLVFTLLARADWALRRATFHGAEVTGTLRHPAIAPHLRALERRLPDVEALLDQ